MRSRPLLFIILALIHLFEPVIKILFFKISTGFDFETVFNNVLSIGTIKGIFDFWFLFPLGGFALLNIKRWSYWLFVSVQCYSIIGFITYEEYAWPYLGKTPSASAILLVMINVMVVIYFALPHVRRPFFDPSVRWWETAPRFTINKECIIRLLDGTVLRDSVIINISRSGLFIKASKLLFEQDYVIIDLGQVYGAPFQILAEIRNRHKLGNDEGFGAKFHPNNIFERYKLIKLMNQFKAQEQKHRLTPT